jgi:cytochrome oxidase Cu insertion factor (SCO1/SenC/PrrC family)
VLKVHKGQEDLKVRKVPKDLKVLKVGLDPREDPVEQVEQVLKVQIM